jgi:hypothetical protein
VRKKKREKDKERQRDRKREGESRIGGGLWTYPKILGMEKPSSLLHRVNFK